MNPDKEQQTNRRIFIQHTALAAGAAAGYGLALKTDALAQQPNVLFSNGGGDDGSLSYSYS